jgi:hypothetical protein
MSEIDVLRAELTQSNALLALAEHVILGYKSGLIPVFRDSGGAWGKEKDQTGLREMLEREEGGRGTVRGKRIQGSGGRRFGSRYG